MTWVSGTPLFFIIFSVPVFFGDAVFISLNELLFLGTQILFSLSSFIHFLPNLLFGKSATVLFLRTYRFPAYKSPHLTNTSIVIRQLRGEKIYESYRGAMRAPPVAGKASCAGGSGRPMTKPRRRRGRCRAPQQGLFGQ